tara:strand:- start:9 stop:305 length:297 start_codon:yes stop_codon:yes gene_type:complete
MNKSEDLSKQFNMYVAKINLFKMSGNPIDISNDEKLDLYKFYKIGKNEPLGAKPGLFNPIENAKWKAHKSALDMSPDQAQENYILLAKKIISKISIHI